MKLRGLKWRMASVALSAGKTSVLKVDDETVIGYDDLHTQERANQLSVALNFKRCFLGGIAELHT